MHRWPSSCLRRVKMELIKGRKATRQQQPDEEKLRFPILEQTWEVSCGAREWEESIAGNEKADRPAFTRRFGGSAA